MGFRALLLGVERKSSWFDDQPVDLGSPYGVVKRCDIYPLYTEDLTNAVMLWKDYRRFGLPHGGGYAAEAEEYITLISAFEDEYDEGVRIITQRNRERAGSKK